MDLENEKSKDMFDEEALENIAGYIEILKSIRNRMLAKGYTEDECRQACLENRKLV